MDGGQITKILSSLPETFPLFNGVYTNSKIPDLFLSSVNGFIIANTLSGSETDKGIGHWVSLVCRDGVLYFLDSFAMHPSVYKGEIYRIFSSYLGDKKVVFESPLQSPNSYVCGAYTVYFSYMMCINRSVYEIKMKFSVNKKCNDKFVRKFIMKLTGTSVKCNSEFCPAYMFMTNCSKRCSC